MSSVVIAGDTSGSVTLQAPAIAGSTVLTLPATSGTIAIGGTTPSFSTLTVTGATSLATSSGSVGVGTSSPTNLLTVNGTMQAGAIIVGQTGTFGVLGAVGYSNNAFFSVNTDAYTSALFGQRPASDGTCSVLFSYGTTSTYGTNYWKMDAYSTGLGFINSTGGEVMLLTSSGNVLVGTTTNLGSTTRMSILSAGDGIKTQVGNGYAGLIIGNTSGTASYNAELFYNNNFSSLVGYIQISGTTASYVSASDYRLKENIVPMIGALDKVAQLKPVTYKWKSDGSDGQGFIAHELAEVCPDAVSGEKDAVNEDGTIKPQGIDTSFLVATLTAAIQELNATVTAQAATIEQLKAKVGI
jgi:hypothetical protein